MTDRIDQARLQTALAIARRQLLAERNAAGYWVGELSSSALSTATAVVALTLADREAKTTRFRTLVEGGLRWLAEHANTDGGWGDTVRSLSNISTTTLGWAAFGVVPGADERYRETVANAEKWLAHKTGGIQPDQLAPAIIQRYGKDRTFSVPILTLCALAGRLGKGEQAWRYVIPLPFELAAFPHQWFAALRLPVVSYALPALIAIGQARHHHLPSRNPIARIVRNLTRARTLEVLTTIQPANGGFLEATPLTSFVTMSLAASGQVNHVVTKKALEFLVASALRDGSWPIDTNLATWVTTLSVNALAETGDVPIPTAERSAVCEWLLGQQYQTVHPYTDAAPGGWAWTDLPGGVPDADDTPGALLALRQLGNIDQRVRAAAERGIVWLLNLQNSDGGMPTFCRGWTNLPFDRSGEDLTAHALRAWLAWLPEMPLELQARLRKAMQRAVQYLARVQHPDGSWIPLWFGNQHAPDDINPTYGTAKVVLALQVLNSKEFAGLDEIMSRGASALMKTQQTMGAWSGTASGPVSVEETALALEALAGLLKLPDDLWPQTVAQRSAVQSAVARATHWLVERVETGEWMHPSPIGFYFAKLWYFEKLYPLIFTVGALGRVESILKA